MFGRSKRSQRDFSEELRSHLALEADRLREAGLSEQDALAAARRNLGNMTRVEERFYEAHRWLWFDDLTRDVSYGVRQLRRNPGFTAVAVLTLALGIGATTAMFSVVNGVLLKPLPYPNPNRVMLLYSATRTFSVSTVSYPDFLDWQRMNRSFTGLAGYRWESFNLAVPSGAEVVSALMVSADFFKILGIPPRLGRGFSAADDHLGAAPTAVLSYSFWQKHFGGRKSILGEPITMGGQSYAVIGVLPKNFWFFGQSHNQVFVPIGIYKREWTNLRSEHPGMFVVGRRKPGITQSQAQADMTAVAERLAQEYPKDDAGYSIKVARVSEWTVKDSTREALWLLLSAVCFVLLIACVNVANLLLSRAAGRQKEIAIRSALGAGVRRVVRQLLTESVLLSLFGCGLGVLLAWAGMKFLIAYIPADLPHSKSVGIDPRVLLFAIGLSVLTGIFFGLAPALRSARPDVQDTLKEGGRSSAGGQNRLQRSLVTVEVGLSLVLLIAAGLTLKSIWYLDSVNLGFNPNHLLSFEVSLPSPRYLDPNNTWRFYKDLLIRLRALPGVKAAGATSLMPLSGNDNEKPFYVAGRPRPQRKTAMPDTFFYMTTPGYLSAMGIVVRRGRYFTDRDTLKSQPVVVIDDAFARTYFPHQDPIGQDIILADPGFDIPREVVGVVDHVKTFGPAGLKNWKVQSQLYFPIAQIPDQVYKTANMVLNLTLVVRTPVDPRSMIATVTRTVHLTDNGVAVNAMQTVDEMERLSVNSERFNMILMALFAALALVLAAIGIYGVISYAVSQRTHEFGIRMALGAQKADVLRLVLGQGMRLALIGVGIGIFAALGLTRLLSSLLYGVKPTDPLTFIAVALILFGVALLACYIPARRATKVDPMTALRYE